MKQKLYYQFAGSCSLLVFAFLGYVVKFYPQWFHRFDTFFTTPLYQARPNFQSFFLWITQFANPLPIILLFLAISMVLLYGKQYAEVLWLSSGMVLIAGLFNPLFKLFFARPRPDLTHLVTEHSHSFPSGHAASSMVFYGALILLLPNLLHKQPIRLFLQGLLVLIILAIGCSRIYLGVHYPTDILGGYTLSLGWLLLTYPIYEKQRFIWRFKNKQN
ncbi:phosphatase PAP2 family protein [Enterococcus sp. LJL98]